MLIEAFVFAITSAVVHGLNVTSPSLTVPWAVGQTNILSWTNATWDVNAYNYSLEQPFNVTITNAFIANPEGPVGTLELGTFIGTNGTAAVDMSNWEQEGPFLLQFMYYAAPSEHHPSTTIVFFGSSSNFTMTDVSSTAKVSASGVGADSANPSLWISWTTLAGAALVLSAWQLITLFEM